MELNKEKINDIILNWLTNSNNIYYWEDPNSDYPHHEYWLQDSELSDAAKSLTNYIIDEYEKTK